jgi:hypothetical protein
MKEQEKQIVDDVRALVRTSEILRDPARLQRAVQYIGDNKTLFEVITSFTTESKGE